MAGAIALAMAGLVVLLRSPRTEEAGEGSRARAVAPEPPDRPDPTKSMAQPGGGAQGPLAPPADPTGSRARDQAITEIPGKERGFPDDRALRTRFDATRSRSERLAILESLDAAEHASPENAEWALEVAQGSREKEIELAAYSTGLSLARRIGAADLEGRAAEGLARAASADVGGEEVADAVRNLAATEGYRGLALDLADHSYRRFQEAGGAPEHRMRVATSFLGLGPEGISKLRAFRVTENDPSVRAYIEMLIECAGEEGG